MSPHYIHINVSVPLRDELGCFSCKTSKTVCALSFTDCEGRSTPPESIPAKKSYEPIVLTIVYDRTYSTNFVPPFTYCPYSYPYLLLPILLPLTTTTPTPLLTYYFPYSSPYLLLPLLLPLPTITPTPPLTYYYPLFLSFPTTTPTPPLTYYYPYSSP